MDVQIFKFEGLSVDQKNSMILGEYIIFIIMMDYGNGKFFFKNNVFSQINGSLEDFRKFRYFVGRRFLIV